MRAWLSIFAIFAAAHFATGTARGQGTDGHTKMATQIKDLINAGDYAGIQTQFNQEMGGALPLEKSSAFFSRLTQQLGKLQTLGEPQPAGGGKVFPAKFEKGMLDMQLTLDGRGLIAGLVFKPRVPTKPEPQKPVAQLTPADRYTKAASQLKELINAGDFAGIQGLFNPDMGAAFPPDKTKEFFAGLTQQAGKIQKLGKPQAAGEMMVFPAVFEKETLDMQITLDGRGLIAGLAFVPHTPTESGQEKQ